MTDFDPPPDVAASLDAFVSAFEQYASGGVLVVALPGSRLPYDVEKCMRQVCYGGEAAIRNERGKLIYCAFPIIGTKAASRPFDTFQQLATEAGGLLVRYADDDALTHATTADAVWCSALFDRLSPNRFARWRGDYAIIDKPFAASVALWKKLIATLSAAEKLSPEDLERRSHDAAAREIGGALAEMQDWDAAIFELDETQPGDEITNEMAPSSESHRKPIESVENHTWPPDDGWRFRPGEFAFRGKSSPLRGKLWELLKFIVESRGPVTEEELRRHVWSDSAGAPSTIRSQLSNLRRELRKALKLPATFDPIPHIDTGPRRAWKLHDDLRPGR